MSETHSLPTLLDLPLISRVRRNHALEHATMQVLSEHHRELRLAGLRIKPRTNGPSRTQPSSGLSLVRIANGAEVPIAGLPVAKLDPSAGPRSHCSEGV